MMRKYSHTTVVQYSIDYMRDAMLYYQIRSVSDAFANCRLT